jgi:uncharacterized membrane protein YgcG
VRRLKIRKNSWIIVPVLVLSLFSSPAKAETFETNGANDFFFTLESNTTFTIRTFAQSRGIDSMLWLYDSNNQMLVANDDHFGLDSYISYPVQNAGIYRIRTGVCCGDPNRWYGDSYTFESSSAPTNAPETTTTTTSTTTTTVAPYLNPPLNLRVISTNESKVYLEWDSPVQSNVEVERYAIFWSCNNWSSALAISSMTNVAIIENLESGTSCEFRVRADNDSLSVYSVFTDNVTGTTETTTTTSTTTTSTTTTSTTTTSTTTTPPPEPETTTTVEETVNTAPEVDEPENNPVDVPVNQEPPITVPEETQDTADTAVENIFDTPMSDENLSNAVDDLVADAGTPEELTAVVNALLDQELTDSQFNTVINSVFSEELSDEQFSAAIEAIFDEPISDEKFASVIDAVLDEPLSNEQFEAVIGILESDSVSEEQVSQAVDSILENGVTEDQATDLATSAKVLESIEADQATEIFQELAVENLTTEEEAALVEVLTNAPTEIKEAFEEEIDIFGEGLDDYVPTGSEIDVEARRALIAVTTVLTTITTAPMPSGGNSAPSGGGAGGGPSGGGGSGNTDRGSSRSRRK